MKTSIVRLSQVREHNEMLYCAYFWRIIQSFISLSSTSMGTRPTLNTSWLKSPTENADPEIYKMLKHILIF